ncbi:MAG: hypothetical protein CMJ90_20105 [Planctomycetes bacterium]|nr:hypothetical protein [Planctomycetota bacterium]
MGVCGIVPRFERAPAIVPGAEGGLAPQEGGVDVRVVRRVWAAASRRGLRGRRPSCRPPGAASRRR